MRSAQPVTISMTIIGIDRAAQPAQNARRAMAERQQAVEQCGRVGLLHAESNDLRLTAERADEPRRPKVNAQADDLGHQHRAEGTKFHALFTRSGWPAPTFWLTKVANAIEKQVTGRKAKPSTLLHAPQPAMAYAPKELMLDCTITLAIEMTEFCTPEGKPCTMTALSDGPSNLTPASGRPILLGAHQLGEGENGTDRLGSNGGEGCRAYAEARASRPKSNPE